jgi:hypothetical protein
MQIKTLNQCLLCFGLYSCNLLASAEAERVEALFPPQVVFEVDQQALEPERRAYLKTFGVDERTLDVFGGIFVVDYLDTVPGGLRWGDIQPDALSRPNVKYDTTGMVDLPPLPPAGVHPRMFFIDAERAAHRKRLEETRGGREAWKIMMGYSELLKGHYDSEAEYAQPDTFKGSFGTRGFLPLFRASSTKEIWEAYSSGQLPDGMEPNVSQLNPGLCAIEAFRCWLYDDAEGARKVAKAMETALRHELSQIVPGHLPGDKGSGVDKRYFTYNLTYVYDFIYNYLSAAQKELFHGSIVAANLKSNQYGVFQNIGNTASNWATFSYRQHGWLGLEGDPGYNHLQYLGYKRGMENYFADGFFPGGTCFEAFGKNQIGGEIIYPMARRGDFLAAHPHILACVRDYLPHAIVPWGGAYVAYDRWGGIKPLNQNDILPMKALFPEDRHIDWVYRNTVLPDYSWKEGDLLRVEGYHNNALFAILWGTDYIDENDAPAELMDSESFVDGQRGLVITRSDWSTDALYLHHHVRGQSGGHVFADRSSFMLAGRGRIWAPNPDIGYQTQQNSVVMIDGLQLANRAPARLTDYRRSELATFSTADLRDTVNYDYRRLYALIGNTGRISIEDALAGRHPELPEGWEPEMTCFNDYALTVDSKTPVYSMPRFARPDWYGVGQAETALRRKREAIEVSTAYRTIGMVRPTTDQGEPYVLCLDDWATTDGKVHQYDWQMRLAADLMVVHQQTYSVGPDGKALRKRTAGTPVFTDVLLAPAECIKLDANGRRSVAQIGDPVLLLRVLEMNDVPAEPAAVSIGFADTFTQKLMIHTEGKAATFKVLLYPHLYRRSPMPVTLWDEAGQGLSVTLGTQVDHYDFTQDQDGRTIFTLTRHDPEGEVTVFK